jgi:WD repeat-containing protein 48
MYCRGHLEPSPHLSLSFFHPTNTPSCTALQHCAGVNALAASPDGRFLWTASRDSLIKRWDVCGPEPRLIADFEGHVDWVNDIVSLQQQNELLVSCSSDKTLRVWSTAVEYSEYADDTNDNAAVPSRLATRSTARSAMYRHASSSNPVSTRSLACLMGHSDYVTSLSAAGQLVVSGGLGGEVFLWDLTCAAPAAGAKVSRAKADGLQGSIYSVTMDADGHVIAAGAADGSIWLIDARTARAEAQLRGHSGNVRSVQLRPDGTSLVSASADQSIKVWDLRQRRSLQSLAVHTDSVWTLVPADGAVSSVLSGGRDGKVYRTHLATRTSECLAWEQGPITAIAPLPPSSCFNAPCAPPAPRDSSAMDGDAATDDVVAVWVATTRSTVRRWNLRPAHGDDAGMQKRDSRETSGGGPTPVAAGSVAAAQPVPSLGEEGRSEGIQHHAQLVENERIHSFVAGSLPALRARSCFANGAPHPPPLCTAASLTIPGSAPIRKVAVLTDRRHVLTQDADDEVLLWDLTLGRSVRELGKVPLRDAERSLFDPAQNVSPWFQPDTRLGCLAGVMSSPSCFLAEAYRRDLGEEAAAPDAKVNMAVLMLRALFQTWADQRAPPSPHEVGAGAQEDATMATASQPSAEDVAAAVGVAGNGAASSSIAIGGGGGAAGGQYAEERRGSIGMFGGREAFVLHRDVTPPVVVVSGTNGVNAPWRRSINDFDGTEREGEMVPHWVADCVLRGAYPSGRDLKMAFSLVPAPGSGLPSLLQSKLNAPRVLGIDKVADYVLRKMAEQGVVLAEEPLFWCPEKQARWEAEREGISGSQVNDGGPKASAAARAGDAPSVDSSTAGHSGASTFAGGALSGLAAGIRQLRPVAVARAESTAGGGNGSVAEPLLITCGGAAVPWDFTLAAVKQWMWKRSEDLRLEYGIRQPGTELKPPTIKPPV